MIKSRLDQQLDAQRILDDVEQNIITYQVILDKAVVVMRLNNMLLSLRDLKRKLSQITAQYTDPDTLTIHPLVQSENAGIQNIVPLIFEVLESSRTNDHPDPQIAGTSIEDIGAIDFSACEVPVIFLRNPGQKDNPPDIITLYDIDDFRREEMVRLRAQMLDSPAMKDTVGKIVGGYSDNDIFHR